MRIAWLVVFAGCGFSANNAADPRDGAIDSKDPADAALDATSSVTCWSRWMAGSVTFSGVTALRRDGHAVVTGTARS